MGLRQFSMYGTRNAATNWANEYTEKLWSWGFNVGQARPCNFHHPNKDSATTVHGDDFTSTSTENDLKWLETKMRETWEIKTTVLGPDEKKTCSKRAYSTA